MLKKLLAILMVFGMLACSLPLSVTAATGEEEQRIRDQITSVYWQTLSSSGRSSLHGFCGVMAGWELYHLGVTATAVTNNGNEMYDILKESDQIREGYSAQCYPASEYSIEEALNTITEGGTRDAYNIMVGFQRTRTAAGSLYGHVTIIHAVLNGNVYFTEGFMTPYNADPSQAMVCTIGEFAEYYNSWASFEGIIYFGDGSRIAGCDTYGCNLFAMSQSPTVLLTKPDMQNGEAVRTVFPGERVYANGICENADGVMFYRIVENGEEYYALAQQLKAEWFLSEDLTVSDLLLPSQVDKGEDFWLSGVIRSGQSIIVNCILEVKDQNGCVIMSSQIEKESTMLDLGTDSVNTRSDISSLTDGCYTYSIYCDLQSSYYQDGEIADHIQRVMVTEQEFLVGSAVPAAMSKKIRPSRATPKVQADGWKYQDGKWYFCENGMNRVGWFCYEGIDYYFLSDGSAATGWQNINGKDRYFSETGAMRTGWLETENGTYYMLSNGIPATGLIRVGERQYLFGEDGIMLADTAS